MNSQPDEKRQRELAQKWLDGTITSAEKQEFAAWYNADGDAPLDIPSGFAESEDALRERILNKINNRIFNKTSGRRKKTMLWIASIAASFAVMFIAAAIHFHFKKHHSLSFSTSFHKKHKVNDVAPGGDKAMLTLADGSKIVLNDAKDGVIAKQGLTRLNKTNAGQLVYQADQSSKAAAPSYNTVTTPKGGQFRITLSDGTKVWLNAASSITFPTTFSAEERKVAISGEVYFEVASNKHVPFRVVSGKQEVEDIGTCFDIKAYDDERSISTTLVEGAVKISSGGQSALLVPGQQATISNKKPGPISVKTVNTEVVLAWKNGNFEFESEELHAIMRQVARWYDIKVIYDGNVKPRRFTASVPRNVNLSKLLEMLKFMGVNFRIDGQTVVVSP
jgi:ferric-dicitrate binding protein FerR (iron transport regulator)